MGLFLKNIGLNLRVLARNAGLSLWIIATLGLVIGATVAVFSVVDALLLRPVNIQDPPNVVVLFQRDKQGLRYRATEADFIDWREKTTAFTGIAGSQWAKFVMTGLDRPFQVSGARVTDNFFSLFGVQPIVGRGFRAGEDGAGHPGAEAHIAVITYQMWRGVLGGTNDVLARKIQLNGQSYEIVGVLPPDFFLFDTQQVDQPQVWVPIGMGRVDRESHDILAFARLKGGRERAVAEMAALGAAEAREFPDTNGAWAIYVQDLRDYLTNGKFRARLLMVSAAVAMVLLVACTNIAGLLLTWAISRRSEMAVRLAVGASARNLWGQLMGESLLLTLTGAALGFGFAWLLIRAAPALLPANLLPTGRPPVVDVQVFGFAFLVAAVAGVLLGLAPALAASRMEVASALKEGSRGGARKGSLLFRQAMVIVQVGLALILLASSWLMVRSLLEVMGTNPGFETRNAIAFPLYVPPARYDERKSAALQRQLVDRLSRTAGVEAVGAATDIPLVDFQTEVPFWPDGIGRATADKTADKEEVLYVAASPGYLSALQVPLRGGRFFEESDREGSPDVVVVNEAFAKKFFAGENAVGKTVVLSRPLLGMRIYTPRVRAEIVGVVGDLRAGRNAAAAKPVIYSPFAQNPWSESTWLVIRTHRGSEAMASEVRSAVAELDGDLTPGRAVRFDAMFQDAFSRPRFQSGLTAFFGLVALVLAAIGIYGVQSQDVTQRTNEIGLKMAVGAAPGVIMREVMGRGFRLTLLGIAAGLAGTVAAGAVIRSVLVDVSPSDPFSLAAVSSLLAVVSLGASLFPALRALRVDPVSALRRD